MPWRVWGSWLTLNCVEFDLPGLAGRDVGETFPSSPPEDGCLVLRRRTNAFRTMKTTTLSSSARTSTTFPRGAERTTRGVLEELTDNERLIAVLCGQWGDYGLPPSKSSFAMHAMLGRAVGGHRLEGSRRRLRSLQRAPLQAAAGGAVRAGAAASRQGRLLRVVHTADHPALLRLPAR